MKHISLFQLISSDHRLLLHIVFITLDLPHFQQATLLRKHHVIKKGQFKLIQDSKWHFGSTLSSPFLTHMMHLTAYSMFMQQMYRCSCRPGISDTHRSPHCILPLLFQTKCVFLFRKFPEGKSPQTSRDICLHVSTIALQHKTTLLCYNVSQRLNLTRLRCYYVIFKLK